jgi:hypothetical protein
LLFDYRSLAQGDVIVGWINAATGKGGVDDYFLSGTWPKSGFIFV